MALGGDHNAGYKNDWIAREKEAEQRRSEKAEQQAPKAPDL